MKKNLRALQLKKFDGAGAEVEIEDLKKKLWFSERVELFHDEKIIKLNIRFGELFHICKDDEWDDYRNFLKDSGVNIKVKKWWEFWV